MCRFYGWSHKDVSSMEVDTAMEYWLAIDALEAQEALIACNVADYPHIESKDRGKLHNELHKKAYGHVKKTVIKTTEMLKALGNVGR